MILGDTYSSDGRCSCSSIPLIGPLRLEKRLSIGPKLRVVVIRPAWLIQGPGYDSDALNSSIPLSRRFRRRTYFRSGENPYSAITLKTSLNCIVWCKC